MKYYSEEKSAKLRETFEAEVLQWLKVTTRPMFGCPSYQVENYLFAFLVDEGVVITHLYKTEREILQRRCQVDDFHAGERILRRWGLASIKDREELGFVIPFVRQSYEEALHRARGERQGWPDDSSQER
ncbi:MAG TPA: hypothetical protein G4N98_02060 [Thermoflexia bacterium]|nr:hypothetical protein [Thermoflexia bacterium]